MTSSHTVRGNIRQWNDEERNYSRVTMIDMECDQSARSYHLLHSRQPISQWRRSAVAVSLPLPVWLSAGQCLWAAMAEQQHFYLLLSNLMSPDNTVRKQSEVRYRDGIGDGIRCRWSVMWRVLPGVERARCGPARVWSSESFQRIDSFEQRISAVWVITHGCSWNVLSFNF